LTKEVWIVHKDNVNHTNVIPVKRILMVGTLPIRLTIGSIQEKNHTSVKKDTSEIPYR